MGLPAAKKLDQIKAIDTHIVLIPTPTGPRQVPQQLPFNGIIDGGLVESVLIEGLAAAVIGSTAKNVPPHVPIGGTFQQQPTNQGKIITGSSTVFIGGKAASRSTDVALTCNDPNPQPKGRVIAKSTVLIG